jgi:hypothetical protein
MSFLCLWKTSVPTGVTHKVKSIDRIDPAVAANMSTGRAAANASMSASYVGEHDGLAFALNAGSPTQERNAEPPELWFATRLWIAREANGPAARPAAPGAGPFSGILAL